MTVKAKAEFGEFCEMCIPPLKDQWMLRKVVVTRQSDERQWHFLYNDWVKKEGDSVIGEVLKMGNGQEGVEEEEVNCTWVTSEASGAGTGAGVSFELEGSEATTGKIVMDPSYVFSPGSEVEVSRVIQWRLGDITKLQVYHDGTGWRSKWFLDRVNVTTSTGTQRTFPCQQWLEASQWYTFSPQFQAQVTGLFFSFIDLVFSAVIPRIQQSNIHWTFAE